MDYDPSTGLAKAPRRGLNKSRRGFSSKAKPPSPAQRGKLRDVLGLEQGQPGAESFVRFANGYHMGELTSLHYMIAIDFALKGQGPYGTAEELIAVSAGEDYPDPRPDLLVRAFKRSAKRKSHTDGTNSTSLSKEQLSRRSLSASKGLPSASQVPSLNASRAAQSMTALALLQKRRLRLAAISAASEQDSADNLDGAPVQNTASDKSPGK